MIHDNGFGGTGVFHLSPEPFPSARGAFQRASCVPRATSECFPYGSCRGFGVPGEDTPHLHRAAERMPYSYFPELDRRNLFHAYGNVAEMDWNTMTPFLSETNASQAAEASPT